MTAAICRLVQQRQARARLGSVESAWTSAAQSPATFYLAHELSPVEKALLQGKTSSSGYVGSLLCSDASRAYDTNRSSERACCIALQAPFCHVQRLMPFLLQIGCMHVLRACMRACVCLCACVRDLAAVLRLM